MRFLIVTLGSLGDLLPFLSITKELVARGHEVSIAGSSNFEPFVRGIGIEFTSVLASDRIQRPAEDARLWDVGRIWALGMERVLAPAMRPTYELIRDRTRHDSWIVLARWAVFGARLAEEKLGIPLCTVYMSAEALNACDPSSRRSSNRIHARNWHAASRRLLPCVACRLCFPGDARNFSDSPSRPPSSPVYLRGHCTPTIFP
jgi:UDP:flavonoid glycosyltransferase YjiC (YdhE family)